MSTVLYSMETLSGCAAVVAQVTNRFGRKGLRALPYGAGGVTGSGSPTQKLGAGVRTAAVAELLGPAATRPRSRISHVGAPRRRILERSH